MIAAAVLMLAVATGVWLRYSVGAVTIAYEVGRRVERVRRAGR